MHPVATHARELDMTVTVVEVLREAKHVLLLNDWCQHRSFRDALGEPCERMYASQFCAGGAIEEAARHLTGEEYHIESTSKKALNLFDACKNSLEESIAEWQYQSLVHFNDQHGRTKEEVITEFDRAIEKEEGKP